MQKSRTSAFKEKDVHNGAACFSFGFLIFLDSVLQTTDADLRTSLFL